MIDKIIAKAFFNAMRDSMKELDDEDEEHHFDANSDKCKNCKDFECCRMFHSMLDKVNAANIEESVKDELCRVLVFIKDETRIFDKDIEFSKFRVRAITERLQSLKKCKNLEVLAAILDKSELKYLRGIIFNITTKIEHELNKVIDANRAECNYFMSIFS